MFEELTLTAGQVKFLMTRFNIDDPDKAIDTLLGIMVEEGLDPMDAKYYIMRLMEQELEEIEDES